MRELVASNTEALEQVLLFLGDLSNAQYSAVPPMAQYGIGRHVRHILDLYLALQEGVRSSEVDYDARHRDSDLERNLAASRLAVRGMLCWLQANIDIDDHTLTIKTEVSLHQCSHATLASTFSRELCYLANHTIHHLAYMALMARQLGVKLSHDYGVAPATASYLRTLSETSLQAETVD